ncbi:MAG: hypothetical protein EZS28_030031 [Streblomastix strix]|uniref:Uncharacterized protein n=1 Tax=Streblomastix strix TaxID=222440 RepID=A0A5J4UWI5_9EUKA|nr:MAG: hypothetical protein EZS28_030031 [Streblomastix strix]
MEFDLLIEETQGQLTSLTERFGSTSTNAQTLKPAKKAHKRKAKKNAQRTTKIRKKEAQHILIQLQEKDQQQEEMLDQEVIYTEKQTDENQIFQYLDPKDQRSKKVDDGGINPKVVQQPYYYRSKIKSK